MKTHNIPLEKSLHKEQCKNNENIIKTANCSLKLIKQAVSEKWIKQLAFWHLCKTNYGNSAIYNYRSRMPEIALKHGMSTKSIYNYISLLRSKELVFDFKNNLSLRSIRSIKHYLGDKRKTQITITSDNINDIQNKLYAKLIEYHITKIAFKEAIRRFEKRNLHKLEQDAGVFLPSFSIRNIAKVLNVSTITAQSVLNSLESLGVLIIHKSKPELISKDAGAGFNPELTKDLPAYYFASGSKLYKQQGNAIELIEHPVNLPKLTLKIYSKYCKSTFCKI